MGDNMIEATELILKTGCFSDDPHLVKSKKIKLHILNDIAGQFNR
jgi:hypothetical protein